MLSTVKIKFHRQSYNSHHHHHHHRHQLAFYARLGIIIVIFTSVLQVTHCSNDNVLQVFVNSTTPIEIGKHHAVTCRASHHHNNNSSNSAKLFWSKGDKKLVEQVEEVTLEFKNLSLSDVSEYICISQNGETLNATYLLTFDVAPTMTTTVSEDIKRGMTVLLTCNVTGYPLKESIFWTYENKPTPLTNNSYRTISQDTHRELTSRYSFLKITNVTDNDNGTYYCHFGETELQEPVSLKVLSPPVIELKTIKAVGESNIYLNWTLKDGNSPLTDMTLSFKDESNGVLRKMVIEPSITHYVLKNLSRETQYTDFTINVTNAIGAGSDIKRDKVTTFAKDPTFVPSLSVNGVTSESVTLAWATPQNISEYYHFYNVTVRSDNGKVFATTAYENPFLVTRLQPGRNYYFQVQACSGFTQLCDGISNEKNATTFDGKSSAPQNVKVNCHFDPSAGEASIKVTWDAPVNPQGHVKEYVVSLNGEAFYLDRYGAPIIERLPQSQKTVLANQPRAEFTGQPPNTNFTLGVCAKTRTRQCGETAIGTCTTPITVPDVEELSKANWSAVRLSNDTKKLYFMVSLPAISQRNGTICCFRVVVVRLKKGQKADSLKPPGQMVILTYEQVHNGSDTAGYVAETLDFNIHKAVIGDDEQNSISNNKEDKHSPCHKCWSSNEALIASGVTGSFRRLQNFSNTSDAKKHRKRHASSNSNLPYSGAGPFNQIKDGPLDETSTYTAFLEAIVLNKNQEPMFSQSNYFKELNLKGIREKAAASNNQDSYFQDMGMLIIGSLVVALILVSMALMCVMRWRRKEPGDQEYGLSHSIQQIFRRIRGQTLIPSGVPPDQPPISKEELVNAYQQRHENIDIGFQKEFEELPDRFRDRTAEASEKNASKNRYPDVKAYDQTRVKLSTADGGSDYINANFVLGYKERKKFICAQGPMECSLPDWWRMIWEQRVNLVLMLTNIEEYNKTKCAKYWPDADPGSCEYGNITVQHVGEKKYSDYLVRKLKMQMTGPDGETKDEHEVEQYHYLVWKDYQAPEHPVGIIRFIKRINEVYNQGNPILVHCSAGVGRTGTLVAIDSLLQQLNEEGCVSIFNTICDLRRQRNYLVQSLKQYIFIYRALMEASLFGDTEIAVPDLKTQIEKLKSIQDGRTVSRIQEEFERLSQVIEDRKPFSAGSSEENRHRNRHENVIPYDRNRVILSPMPGLNKEICTYINASFIEGYDSSEQYIIAQDPLQDVTIGDFWRMIVEFDVRSVVMLSEVGEDKCPRYWPEKDQETSHDYIRVKYMQSQSFPFYYRREFTVTNTKAEESCLVTQFQYNGWPVGDQSVPESSRGIVELIDTTFKHKETLDKCLGPTLIHCSAGADRSCIFVALAILVRQMMNESRVDVFSVVRKLRSQRQGLFQNLAQYEFLFKGLELYADLHVKNGNCAH